MTENERFEIHAAVCYTITGVIPIGKEDVRDSHSREERKQMWTDFEKAYGRIIDVTIAAVEPSPPQ